ncbi:MAG: hypothetical protein RLY43_2291 [Bacteroidota bacterium]|jgi:hypothetical protein
MQAENVVDNVVEKKPKRKSVPKRKKQDNLPNVLQEEEVLVKEEEPKKESKPKKKPAPKKKVEESEQKILTLEKGTIKRLMKECLDEDKKLCLEKKIHNRITETDKQLEEVKEVGLYQLVFESDYDFNDVFTFNRKDKIKSLKDSYDEVVEYLEKGRDYKNIENMRFDVGDYYLYKDHLEEYNTIMDIVEECKKKIESVLGVSYEDYKKMRYAYDSNAEMERMHNRDDDGESLED